MVEVSKQIASVGRELRSDKIENHDVTIQRLTQSYPADLADVWDAVTSADRITRWFLPVSGDLQVGGRYQLQGNAGGKVLECTPPADGTASYRVTWEMGGGITWLTVRCTAEDNDNTSVELEHVARTGEIPPGMWETFGPGATGVGWDGGMLGLALHLGAIEGSLTPDEAPAWAFTDEGKAFYKAAADGWAKAHVAAGADRETAEKAAQATFGFYTGQTPNQQ